MGRTFTANRGYPTCNEDTDENLPSDGQYTGKTRKQQTAVPDSIARTLSNGIFNIRIWGNFCYAAGGICRSLKNIDTALLTSSLVNEYGYAATFRPASHCGPARWPSPEMQRAVRPMPNGATSWSMCASDFRPATRIQGAACGPPSNAQT